MFREVRNKIRDILEQMKGFSVSTSSNDDTKMIIDYNGNRFLVSFHQIVEPDENAFNDIDKYIG